jgi:hypothetical protein
MIMIALAHWVLCVTFIAAAVLDVKRSSIHYDPLKDSRRCQHHTIKTGDAKRDYQNKFVMPFFEFIIIKQDNLRIIVFQMSCWHSLLLTAFLIFDFVSNLQGHVRELLNEIHFYCFALQRSAW